MISRSKGFKTIICVLLLTSSISSSVIKEALEEHLKDISHKDEEQSLKFEKAKGEKDHHTESQTDDSHTNQKTKTNDEVKYLKKDAESKVSSDKGAHGGYNTKQDKAEDSNSNGFKTGHKKGHHKQGFQNSYHKDESSNKSTFFDDFNDEGDQAGYNSKLNRYDNHHGRNYQGSHNNAQDHVRDNYHGGGHNRYGDNGINRASHQTIGKNHYLDNSEVQNRYNNGRGTHDAGKFHERREQHVPQVYHDPGWDWQKWDNRRDWDTRRDWDNRRNWDRPQWREPGWEKDYGGPGYYDDHGIRHDGGYGHGPGHGFGYRYGESQNNPVAEIPKNAPVVARRKQTITIYEDPRFTGKEKGQLRREEGDYLELDIQPSSRRYASYDDSYYSGPVRAAESSKINKLVYNYRRE